MTMPKNLSGPVRRSQLISPFGVGSMLVVPGGTSLIIGGLDLWFEPKGDGNIIDAEEFKVYEWRLQQLLGVDHFRLPPDYRDSYWNQGVSNAGLSIPAYRFPTWHFCPGCRFLKSFPMYASGKKGKLKCPDCEKNKKIRYMSQVRFIAMCENGHVQDFPWREWVHRQGNPTCQEKLRLIATSSATLAGQKVKCDCGKERTLFRITDAYPGNNSTVLSKTLREDNEPFLCQGKKPWLGEDAQEQCNAQLRGSLRGASNLYFAQIASSIYIPISEDTALQKLENILQTPPVSTLLSILHDVDVSTDKQLQAIRKSHPQLIFEFSDSEIRRALEMLAERKNPETQDLGASNDEQTEFRRTEYSVLGTERNDEFLEIREANIKSYKYNMAEYFSKIMFVSRMRETRVLSGFTRVFANNTQSREQRQTLLWREMPAFERWLPAYTVFGEGLFFEFSKKRLQEWEVKKEIIERMRPLVERNVEMEKKRRLQNRKIDARFVLIHTFSHLLMNRLTFECGYSSAALRERLYVSTNPKFPMSGVLIYTADGDSEGTLGGLVRMGRPENLEPVFMKAIESAKWCSADPVCMELGNSSGQGPDSCNLAACHNCALVPETACEEFNHFLDRGVVVGDFEETIAGYFAS
jgi:transcriptional regulator with XRE-family HTH domain